MCLGPCFTDAKSIGRKELGLGKGTEGRLEGVTQEGMLTVQEQHDEWPLTSGWELLSAMAWTLEVTSMGEALRELGWMWPVPLVLSSMPMLLSYIRQ